MLFNLLSDDWDERRLTPGYSWSRTSVGRRLGGELLGASVYELPHGERSWPYHTHYGNEELLIVLDGRPILRTPEGERELQAGDATIFRRGAEGAHQVINRSEQRALILVISTMLHPEVSHYLDGGKFGIFAGAPPVPGEDAPLELFFRAHDATDYWEAEQPPA
jgi:uncharacterized cupin superfamily protein